MYHLLAGAGEGSGLAAKVDYYGKTFEEFRQQAPHGSANVPSDEAQAPCALSDAAGVWSQNAARHRNSTSSRAGPHQQARQHQHRTRPSTRSRRCLLGASSRSTPTSPMPESPTHLPTPAVHQQCEPPHAPGPLSNAPQSWHPGHHQQ